MILFRRKKKKVCVPNTNKECISTNNSTYIMWPMSNCYNSDRIPHMPIHMG